MLYLLEPYFWYVRTKTRVNIMWDENIRSPHPYITPLGTAGKGEERKPCEHPNDG